MISVKVKSEEAVKSLNSIKRNISLSLSKTIMKTGVVLWGEIRRTLKESTGLGGSKVTGNLGRSFKPHYILDEPNHVIVGVTSDLVYAGIQDQGGVINPKNVKRLAIPISKEAKNKGLYPKDWPEGKLHLIVNKKTNKVLLAEIIDSGSAGGRQRKSKIIPHFVLKDQVRLGGKYYLRRSINTAMPEMKQILGREIGYSITRAR